MVEKQKLLVVYDRNDNLVALRQVLGKVDAEVIEATSSDEVLAATLHHDFAVALLDVQMPGMTGFELAERLRGDNKTQVMPIVFLTTNYIDQQHMFEGYEAGAVDYIIKPFPPEVLQGKVNVFLEMARYRRELEMHRARLEMQVAERTANLKERVKELKCLYAVSSLVAEPFQSIDQALKDALDLIPPGMHYPEIARARIVFDGRQFTSEGFRETPWKLSADIVASGEKLGSLAVFHLNERPLLHEGPFLREERSLINELAHQFGIMVENKRAAQILLQSEARLSEAQRLAHIGNWDLDLTQHKLTCSGEIYRICEMDQDMLEDSYDRFLETIHPEDRALVNDTLTSSLPIHTLRSLDHRLIMKDGRIKHVHERCQTVFDPQGNPIGSIGTMQDITERKQGEEALLAANEELKHLDALKSAFVSTVSHELRTPLAITKEGINLVLDKITGEINEMQERVLRTAGNNIGRLERIINNLLDISQIEERKRRHNIKLVNLVALVTQVVSEFYPQAKKKNIELRTTFSAMHIDLYIDSDNVVQIFTNLIDNAIKYTEHGHIDINVTDSNHAVECIVADSGIGILEEDLPSVFLKFQQFGRTAGPGPKGTGLGLSIVKGLVELNQGNIQVESRFGEGTKFTFTFPKHSTERILIEGGNNGEENTDRG